MSHWQGLGLGLGLRLCTPAEPRRAENKGVPGSEQQGGSPSPLPCVHTPPNQHSTAVLQPRPALRWSCPSTSATASCRRTCGWRGAACCQGSPRARWRWWGCARSMGARPARKSTPAGGRCAVLRGEWRGGQPGNSGLPGDEDEDSAASVPEVSCTVSCEEFNLEAASIDPLPPTTHPHPLLPGCCRTVSPA